MPALLLGLGNVQRHTRRLAEARALAVEARALAERINAAHLRGLALVLESLTIAWAEPDGSAPALRLAEQAMASFGSRDFYWEITAAAALGDAAHLHGDPYRCMTVLVEAGGGPDLPRVPPFLRPHWHRTIIVAALAAGAPVEEWAERLVATARGLMPPGQLGHARVAYGLLAHARGDRGASAIVLEGAELFSEAGMTQDKGWALITAARCLTEVGDGRAALPLLARAAELGRRSGSSRLLQDAEHSSQSIADALEPAAGRRPAGLGADLSRLTEWEREIAAIAGTGLKTREIAARLSVSPRTVDVHLARIYRKLNISSRTVLARLVAEGRVP